MVIIHNKVDVNAYGGAQRRGGKRRKQQKTEEKFVGRSMFAYIFQDTKFNPKLITSYKQREEHLNSNTFT